MALQDISRAKKITFIVFPQSLIYIEFLEKFKVPVIKYLPESTHYPLIEKVLKKKKPILISNWYQTRRLDKKNFLRKKL